MEIVSDLSVSTLETMGSALVQRGIMTQAAVDADLADVRGQDASQSANPTSAPQGLGADMMVAPSNPGSYQAPWVDMEHLPKGLSYDMGKELEWRTFMQSEGVPGGVGSKLMQMAHQGMMAPPQTEDQLYQSRHQAMAELHRLWGPERDARLAIVNREIDRMEQSRPGLRAYLTRTGLANSSYFGAMVYNLAEAQGRVKPEGTR